jgi:hypothetical protein
MPEGLFEIAAAEGIGVKFIKLPAPLLGLYDSRPGEPPMILLHEKTRKDQKLFRCIFAEEIGHHFTLARNIMAFAVSSRYIYNKYDQLALWWATQHLVPFESLAKAINSGIYFTHELAEHFDVTERFMESSLKLYYEKARLFYIRTVF